MYVSKGVNVCLNITCKTKCSSTHRVTIAPCIKGAQEQKVLSNMEEDIDVLNQNGF